MVHNAAKYFDSLHRITEKISHEMGTPWGRKEDSVKLTKKDIRERLTHTNPRLYVPVSYLKAAVTQVLKNYPC